MSSWPAPIGGTAPAGTYMKARHGTFSAEVTLGAPPASVFSMFAELPRRRLWFHVGAVEHPARHDLDFRVGGEEIARGAVTTAAPNERVEYRSRFLDIEGDTRIVHVYELLRDGTRQWASIVTVELGAEQAGTRLRHTEQYTLLSFRGDGEEEARRLEVSLRLALQVRLPAALSRSGQSG